MMRLTELEGNGGAMIRGLTNINVLLGRNGSGKSRFLRDLDGALWSDSARFNVRYISPERPGSFEREGQSATNIESDQRWIPMSRRTNQAFNFKNSSAYFLRELETKYHRRILSTPILRTDPSKSFENDFLARINHLLTNVSIEQANSYFSFRTTSGEIVKPSDLSSGEAEVITLATEILYFFETIDPTLFNVLLLDEPDVHLHPDLQGRFANLLTTSLDALDSSTRENVAICIATHSTPLVCALSSRKYTSIGTKEYSQNVVVQVTASEQLRKSAPFFGHPLSLAFSNDVLLILEGEDDERVWQQAARTAQGRIRLFPVLATSVAQQTELEHFCARVLSAAFDDPIAYSLRDGDSRRGYLDPLGCVTRFKLQCYEIENFLVTDECLQVLGTTWKDFQHAARDWLQKNSDHNQADLLSRLLISTDRLRDTKIKELRTLICGISKSNKPWEVVVGQAIGQINPLTASYESNSIASYLGDKAAKTLLRTHRT